MFSASGSLILDQFSLLARQRDFYRKNIQTSGATEAYWRSWRHEGEIIFYRFKNEAEHSLPYYTRMAKAFGELPDGLKDQNIRGFWEGIVWMDGSSLTPEIERFFKEMMGLNDPALKLVAYRTLMRSDPVGASDGVLKAYIEYRAQHASIEPSLEKFFVDFLTPAVNRLAVSEQAGFLQTIPQVLNGVLDAQDPQRLLLYRLLIWPYINVLDLTGRRAEAVAVTEKCWKILKEGSSEDMSPERLKFLAELDLKLVWMEGRTQQDPGLVQYLYDPSTPSYLRQRAEIEPPRSDGPLDLNGFGKLDLVHGQKYTSVISRSSEFYGPQGGGVTSSTSFTRRVDAEGNESFESHGIDAATRQAPQDQRWQGYVIDKMPYQLEAYALGSSESRLIDRRGLIENGKFFQAAMIRDRNKMFLKMYVYDLTSSGQGALLGQIEVPDSKSGASFSITGVAVGADRVFVATTAGFAEFQRTSVQPIPEADKKRASGVAEYEPYVVSKPEQSAQPIPEVDKKPASGFSEYEPYYVSKPEQALSAVNQKTTGSAFWRDQSNGAPDERITALAYHNGIFYMGTGLADDFLPELKGVSGLIAYDPVKDQYALLASSRALDGKSLLEQGEPYQIKAMLVDPERECLWFAVGGNDRVNGVWRYDFKTQVFHYAVPETLSVQDIQWFRNQIVYAMYGSGWVLYDPDQNKKTWLMSYTVSAWTGSQTPIPPNGVTGEPLYGYPKTRLWPFVFESDGSLLTVGWDTYELLLHRPGQPVEALKKLDSQAGFVSQIQYLAKDQYGTWLLAEGGQVFKLNKKDSAQPGPVK